jgi:hypothetical protein
MMTLIIDPAGCCRCIYDEAIDLHLLGDLQIERASLVEPDAAGEWWADCSPLGGPNLGPFDLRSQAISAEAAWLSEHLSNL